VNQSISAPTITCSSGALDKLNATFSSNAPDSWSNWKGSGTASYSAAGTYEITVSGIKCGTTDVSGSTPCGSISVTAAGGGVVSTIGKNSSQTIAAGGSITIKCNSDCQDSGDLLCCTTASQTLTYDFTYKIDSGTEITMTISSNNGRCSLSQTVKVSTVNTDSQYTINNTGSSEMKCKFGG
jgi:hypothetical protein